VERNFERVNWNACSTFLLRNVEDLGWRSRCTDQATDWTIRGLILDRDKGFYCYPRRQYRLCGPPSLLFNGCRGLFHRRKTDQGVKFDHSAPSPAWVQELIPHAVTVQLLYAFMARIGSSPFITQCHIKEKYRQVVTFLFFLQCV